MTQVRVARYADCPFSAAVELAEKALGHRNGFYITPSPPLGERVRFAAASTRDVSDEARGHDALLLAWRPQTPEMFPEFRGVLTVRPKNRGAALTLNGQYTPPYGTAGKLFDAVVGRLIARSTLSRLLDEIGRDIESAYRQESRITKTA